MLALFTSFTVFAQDVALTGDAKKGETLFKNNCTACHALDKKLIGPDLKGIVTSLEEEGVTKEWIHSWVMDNESLRKSGDKRANEIFKEYNEIPMNLFKDVLSDQDLEDILTYVDNPPKEVKKVDAAPVVVKKDEYNSGYVTIGLISIGILLLIVLFKFRRLVKLKLTANVLNEDDEKQVQLVSQLYAKTKQNICGLTVLLLLFAFYGVWAWFMGIGVDKGYEPDQPIYFSHNIHAGVNKIDCQLCHSGAKYGKVSEIPSLSVCMNCHKAIVEYNGDYIEPDKTRDFYTNEIKKIYDYIGWDEANQKYTGAQKPVKWARIHNMPDFVFFNHSQHVVAGEKVIIEDFNKKNANQKIDVVCKACHGQVDTMDKVKMANDFTMGWCVDCHRTTDVDMTNKYNAAYYGKLHEKLAKEYGQDNAKITVDAIGGLECGKCHY